MFAKNIIVYLSSITVPVTAPISSLIPRLQSRVAVYLLMIPFFFSGQVFADGFEIANASIELNDKVYQLNADLKFEFSDAVLEAINNGVNITLALDIELLRPRNYFWDDEIATLEQRYQLQFHALSEQYIVRNLNSGAQFTFFSLQTALDKIGIVRRLPVIDEQLLIDRQNNKYYARIKTQIENASLPVPLRLNALISPSWWLGSDWYNLDL